MMIRRTIRPVPEGLVGRVPSLARGVPQPSAGEQEVRESESAPLFLKLDDIISKMRLEAEKNIVEGSK
jgi:hypothetical protein